MAETTYNYTKVINVGRLTKEIDDATWIANVVLVGIEVFGDDDVYITFADELIGDDMTTLNLLVANHVSTELPQERFNDFGFFSFSAEGTVANKWLRVISGGSLLPSNQQPVVFINPGVVSSLSYYNETNESDLDIEIYKNDSLTFTWPIRDGRIAWKGTFTAEQIDAMTFSPGDRLSVFAGYVFSLSIPRNAVVTIHYRLLNTDSADGIIASL